MALVTTVTPSMASDWLGVQQSAIPVSVVPQPGMFDAFLSPFRSTFSTLSTAAAKVGTNFVESAGQSLNTLLLQKAGLIPKPQKQGNGIVINYDKGQAGNAPPTSTQGSTVISVAGASPAGVLPAGVNWTWVIVAAAFVGIVLLVRK